MATPCFSNSLNSSCGFKAPIINGWVIHTVDLKCSILIMFILIQPSLATTCFKEFHTALLAAAKQGKVKYVVRPVLPSRCEAVSHCGSVGANQSVNLGGFEEYGV
ncbi:putative UDP-glucose:Glycoprotein Glucosyltransferase [Lupinus albus]|uniref:Putative UDP-glucose:Glycoprotein Glucosyltransferase n=1 Tax=Lupinus albus TaxID=3870 RepID=A0A6A4NM71_LUPAL|nr:putative UDP-glucose:Glycoprotein Glucosyltransferase [Lupinus albus]